MNNNLVLKSPNKAGIKLNKGLVQLFFYKNVDFSLVTIDDYEKYRDYITFIGVIISKTNVRIKDIEDNLGIVGRGFETIAQSAQQQNYIVLSSDKNILLDRLQILLSATKEGLNSGFNEASAILDELLKQGIITTEKYKNIF